MKLLVGLMMLLVSSSELRPQPRPPQELPQPRVMYWWGKVNQHVDLRTGAWETDPDGTSGADLDMLGYCKKWYPATKAVVASSNETITTWRERGNVNAHTAERPSFACVP